MRPAQPALLSTLLTALGLFTLGAPPAASLDYDLLWHRYLADPIYTSLGGADGSETIFAGDYLNAPRQVERLGFWGDGTPIWVSPGTELYADAGRTTSVLAALDANPADSSVTVREWLPGSATPLWSYRIHPCRPLTNDGWAQGKGIQVSDCGSTIAAVVNMYEPGGTKGRLFVFDAGQSAPAIDYPLPDGVATALALSYDGRFIAIYAWPAIYVYDRVAGALRWSGSAGSGNDALAISGDGSYLAWGWWTFTLRRWDGTTYAPLWSTTQGGTYLISECALDPNGELLALGWYRNGTFDDTVIELYDLPSHTLRWDYHYVPVAREGAEPDRNPVDVPSEMVFDQAAGLLGVASWGGLFPEIHVFERDAPTPVFTQDTPGTMFDIDVVAEAELAIVSACGKHVHAGTAGRGGDIYAFAVYGGMRVDEGRSASAGAPPARIHPNPTAGRATIDYRLAQAGPVRLTVHDLQGRAIATLVDAVVDRGEHAVDWTGRDVDGRRLPAGVYLLRMRGADGVRSQRRVVLLDAR